MLPHALHAYSKVYILARELYPRWSPARSRLPASQFRGLSGAESLISATMAWHTDCSVQAGLHAFFRMSKQISPVCRQKTAHELLRAHVSWGLQAHASCLEAARLCRPSRHVYAACELGEYVQQ